MNRRTALLASVCALAVLAAACTSNADADGSSPSSSTIPHSPPPRSAPAPPEPGTLAASACKVPHIVLLREWRGYWPGRSGDIIMLPTQGRPNYMGSGYPHSGPWNYLERVPLWLYGPGYIRAAERVNRAVTIADWAPTTAALLGFHHDFPDGHTLSDALLPASQRSVPPKLIVTLVWDGAGRNVLSQWPTAWPHLKALIPKGTWYENATIGTAPTSTAQDHPLLGTGAFPNRHGIVGNHLRIHGVVREPYEHGPDLLMLPTVADLYDKAHGNRSVVGMVASSPWHLGMMGHGSFTRGGDDDLAVLHEFGGPDWILPFPLGKAYDFPTYMNDLPGLSTYHHYADAIDGRVDGTWRGMDIEEQGSGFNSPERIPYQTKAIEAMIRREGFGQDDVPDLFFTNYKLTDEVGHIWTMNSVEMHDALQATDQYLPTLINFLNKRVGRGAWVLAMTADHGSQPNPVSTGAFRGSTSALEGYIERVFDHDSDDVKVVQSVQPNHIYINVPELKSNGYTLSQVAEYMQRLTQAQLAAPDSIIQPGHENDRVFTSVFPSELMRSLPCLPEARSG